MTRESLYGWLVGPSKAFNLLVVMESPLWHALRTFLRVPAIFIEGRIDKRSDMPIVSLFFIPRKDTRILARIEHGP